MLLGIFFSACRTPRSPKTSAFNCQLHLIYKKGIRLAFCASQDCIELVSAHQVSTREPLHRTANLRSVEHLNCPSHARLSESSSAEDLNGLIRTLMGTPCSKHLQQSDRTSKVDRLLLIWHESHLVCNVLQPGLVCFTVCDHFGQPRIVRFFVWASWHKNYLLLAYYWLLNELLPKNESLVAPFETFFCHKSAHTDHGT